MSSILSSVSQPGAPIQPDTDYRIRFVTAASLFDGHDAAINIIRRLLQASGAEVIHLGHNRSVAEIVDAAVQEDEATADLIDELSGGSAPSRQRLSKSERRRRRKQRRRKAA